MGALEQRGTPMSATMRARPRDYMADAAWQAQGATDSAHELHRKIGALAGLFGEGVAAELRRHAERLDECAAELAFAYSAHIAQMVDDHAAELNAANVAASEVRIEAAGLRQYGRVLFLELERRALRTGTTRGEVWTMLGNWQKVDPR